MRKGILLFCMAAMLFTLSACGGDSAAGATGGVVTNGQAASGREAVDVDLAALNSTMVYAEVYNMMTEPDAYIGKKVRMKGAFAVYLDEATNQYYYAAVISDATACCSQGLEFVLDGDYSYPEDYPEIGDEITVVGELQTYSDGEYQYCNLVHAKFE